MKKTTLHALYSDTFYGEGRSHGYRFKVHPYDSLGSKLKNGIFKTLAAVVVIGASFAPLVSNAQTTTTATPVAVTTVASGTSVTQYPVPNANDTSAFQDTNGTLEQLSNLTIQSVGGGALPTIVTATDGSSVYQIRVSSATDIMQSDRSLTSIDQFNAGDTMNVYGYVNPTSGYVDASIIRDLSIPQYATYMQYNNVSVLTNPTSGTVPANVMIAKDDFFSYPYYQQFNVVISPSTQILYANRNTAPLSVLYAGARANVYGRVNGTTLYASIIRNININPGDAIPTGTAAGVTTGSAGTACPAGYTCTPNNPVTTSYICPTGYTCTSTGTSSSTTSTGTVLNPQTLTITPDNVVATVGTYGAINFKVSGGYSSSAYTIDANGSDTVPGMIFTQTPCNPGSTCGQIMSADTMTLEGTPSQAGTYKIMINANDNAPQPACATAQYPGQATCMIAVAKNYGNQTFYLTVNPATSTSATSGSNTSSGTSASTTTPTIIGVSGPTYLQTGQSASWTITASIPTNNQTNAAETFNATFGDQASTSTPASSAYSVPAAVYGTSAYTGTFTHTYWQPGNYTATFTVTNSATGQTTTSSQNVIVA